MKRGLLCMLFFASAFSLQGEALKIAVPDNWSLTYNDEKELYTMSKQAGGAAGIITISRWSAEGKIFQIPRFIHYLAQGFIKQARKTAAITLKTEKYSTQEIVGVAAIGKCITFEMESGLVQQLFIFSDGQGLWHGQFSGTKAMAKQAMMIVSTITRNKK